MPPDCRGKNPRHSSVSSCPLQDSALAALPGGCRLVGEERHSSLAPPAQGHVSASDRAPLQGRKAEPRRADLCHSSSSQPWEGTWAQPWPFRILPAPPWPSATAILLNTKTILGRAQVPSATSILTGVRWGIITQPGRQLGVMAWEGGTNPGLESDGAQVHPGHASGSHSHTWAHHTGTPHGHTGTAGTSGLNALPPSWPTPLQNRDPRSCVSLHSHPHQVGCSHSNLSWYVTHRSMQKAGP